MPSNAPVSESCLRRRLVAEINKCGIALPIEALGMLGVPDVWYALRAGGSGWIECKCARRPMKEGKHLVRVPHFTDDQRKMLYKMRLCDARAWLLLQVGGKEWLLLEGMDAALYAGERTLPDLRKLAYWQHEGKFSFDGLIDALKEVL